jgi:hypothetical protein
MSILPPPRKKIKRKFSFSVFFAWKIHWKRNTFGLRTSSLTVMNQQNQSNALSRLSLEEIITRLIVDLPANRSIPKSTILRDAQVDLAKYHPGGSQPSITSFVRVCDYFEMCPGMVTLIACWVMEQRITYQQAIHMVNHWEQYQPILDGFQFGVIKQLENVRK